MIIVQKNFFKKKMRYNQCIFLIIFFVHQTISSYIWWSSSNDIWWISRIKCGLYAEFSNYLGENSIRSGFIENHQIDRDAITVSHVYLITRKSMHCSRCELERPDINSCNVIAIDMEDIHCLYWKLKIIEYTHQNKRITMQS